MLETGVAILEEPSDLASPCFTWQGCIDAQGYPDRGRRKHDRAHRQIWDMVHGPRPVGFVIHHRCENKRCLNVAHMALMTAALHAELHPRSRNRRGHFQDTPLAASSS